MIECSSCGKQKNTLTTRNSKLMPGVRLHLCGGCEGMEPRYLIILHGRANGTASVAPYIKKRLYVGNEITAKELIA